MSALALLLVESLRFLHKEQPAVGDCSGKLGWTDLAEQVVCPPPADPVCHCPDPAAPVVVVPIKALWLPLVGVVAGHLLVVLVKHCYARCVASRVGGATARAAPRRRGGGVLD